MKVIASASNEDFIVEVSRDELNRLVTGSNYNKIKVHAIFGRLAKLQGSKEGLSIMADNLRAMATLLESTEPIIRELVDGPAELEAL